MLLPVKIIKKFISDESGQSSTEYILILFLAFMVFTKLKTQLKGIVEGLLGNTKDMSEKTLRDDWNTQ